MMMMIIIIIIIIIITIIIIVMSFQYVLVFMCLLQSKTNCIDFQNIFSQYLFGKLFCASVEASILTKIKICDAVERITGWF